MQQLNDVMDKLGQTYQDFKSQNDQQSADPLDQNKLQKMNDAIDALSAKIEQQSKILSRPATPAHGASNGKNNLSSPEYKQAFTDYARTGQEVKMGGFVSSYDAGYPGTSQINELVSSYLEANSVIRKYAKNIIISRDSLEFVRNKDNVDAAWSDGKTAPDSIEGYEKISIKVNDLIAQPKVTQKLLDDVEMEFDSWFATELGQIFLTKENDAFVGGDGVNKPRGILSYAGNGLNNTIEQIKTGDATKITVDGLINLIYSLDDSHSNEAMVLMNKITVQEVRKLKDSNGQYLWMPGILSGKADTLMGIPLFTMGNIPSIAANNICAIYGNLNKGYVIADHENICIQRDPFTSKPFVSFYCTKRVGGDVINTKAIKLLKVAA